MTDNPIVLRKIIQYYRALILKDRGFITGIHKELTLELDYLREKNLDRTLSFKRLSKLLDDSETLIFQHDLTAAKRIEDNTIELPKEQTTFQGVNQ